MDILVKIEGLFTGKGEVDKATQALEGVGSAAEKTSGKTGIFNGALQGCAGKVVGLATVIGGGLMLALSVVQGALIAVASALGNMMAAAAESQAASLKLNQALANTGQFSRTASNAIQELASAQQKATNVADEVWVEAAGKLLQFGAAAEDIPEYFNVIEGLAGRMGGDVSAAAEAFARAMQGGRTELVRFGFDVDQGATKAERLAEAQRIAATGAGMLRAETMTLGGGWKSLGIAGGDLLENLGLLINAGNWLGKTLGGLATAVSWVVDAFGGLKDTTQDLVKNRAAAERSTEAVEDLGAAASESADQMQSIGTASGEVTKAGSAARAASTEFDGLAASARSAAEAEQSFYEARRDRALGAIAVNPMLDDEQKASRSFDVTKAADQALLDSAQKERAKIEEGYQAAFAAAAEKEDQAAKARQAAEAANAELGGALNASGLPAERVTEITESPAVALANARERAEAAKSAVAEAQARAASSQDRALRTGVEDDSPARLKAAEQAAAAAAAEQQKIQALVAQQKQANEVKAAADKAASDAAAAQQQKAATIAEADPKIAAANELIANLKAKLDNDEAKRKAAMASAEESKKIAALEKTARLESIYADARIEQMKAEGATAEQIAAEKARSLENEYTLAKQIADAKKQDTTELDARYALDRAKLTNHQQAPTPLPNSRDGQDPVRSDRPRGMSYGLGPGEILRGADGELAPGVTESPMGTLEAPSRLNRDAAKPYRPGSQAAAASDKNTLAPAAEKLTSAVDTQVKTAEAAFDKLTALAQRSIALQTSVAAKIEAQDKSLANLEKRIDNLRSA